MPKPLKNKAGTLSIPPKPRRPPDSNRAADDMIAEHLSRVQGPASDQPVIDPKTVISEHMRKLGAQGGKVSGAKRMENLSERQRRNIALRAARARWSKSKPKG